MENARITRDDMTDVEVKIESALNDNNKETGCYSIYIDDNIKEKIFLLV